VKTVRWLALVLLFPWLLPMARAGGPFGEARLNRVNRRLHGQLLDFTRNHGADRRIWSEALHQRRDLYVYLPPGFDPNQLYPLVIWLHGFAQDETSFRDDVVEHLDAAMVTGKLPAAIIACPDGSIDGHACIRNPGSFFINTRAGRFEDFVMHDVWNFVVTNFPIRPEREAHVLAGASMGGGAAYNLAIKYRDRVKVVCGIFPPLNTRWIDCHGRYRGNFRPDCWDWQTEIRRWQIVGRFYGVVLVRVKHIVDPLYDRKDDILSAIIQENPAEMLDAYDLKPGELDMYIGYGGRDEFNIDAQVESFLFLARERGLCIAVGYDPKGRHNLATALRLMPDLFEWLSPLLAPYSPSCP
jgi:pimeloyl-ACP methyl ester carboxylesterase